MTPELLHDGGWLAGQQRAWTQKPLLRRVYGEFHRRIERLIDPALPGRILEVGAGIGNFKERFPQAWATDLLPNPRLDFASDAYALPLANATLSHLVLIDVFHHLSAPAAFLKEARRVLVPDGRLILLEPYISLASCLAYGLFHAEPIGWRRAIDLEDRAPLSRNFYAAQGNATRLFFRGDPKLDWTPFHGEAFAGFAYLFSGGFSRPALYPASWYPLLAGVDRCLSRWPRLFGARCIVGFRNAD